MLYENVLLYGQLSKKSADDYYDDLIKKLKIPEVKFKTEFWGLRDLAYKKKKIQRVLLHD